MTANGSAKLPIDPLASVIGWFRVVFRLIGRIALGGLAIIAAGIVAITMAVLGVLIALAALIFRFTKGKNVHLRRREQGTTSEQGVILEAKQTGQGWTVK